MKPMTKRQILARINKGPTQFAELAQSRRHNNPCRLAARKHCDALVMNGSILLVSIGFYSYYIENTEEAKRKAIIQQIEESSRKDPDTGCTVWTAYSDSMRGPIMRNSLVSKGGGVSVRRWLFEDVTGRKLNGNEEHVRMKPKCCETCIDPAHMVKKTRSQILKGIPKPITVKMAMHKAMVKRWGKNPDAAAIIRSSEKTDAELAEELDMTPSNVWAIRTMKTHRIQATGPFAGLGARP